MEQVEWEVVSEIAGELNAELIKGLLESQGIPAMLSQEGLGHSVLSLTVGPLGRVQVLVPASLVPRAQQVLSDYENGLFESPDTQDSQTEDEN